MAMGTGLSETELAAAPPAEPTALRGIGAWLLAGSLLWWAAASSSCPEERKTSSWGASQHATRR